MSSSSMPRGQDDSRRVSRPVPSLLCLLFRCSRGQHLYVRVMCVCVATAYPNSIIFNIYIYIAHKSSFAHLRKLKFSGFIATL